MAGIGFHLHKLVNGETYTHAAKGYVSSIIITSGPWLTSVISLGLLGAIGIPSFTSADYALFMATITYAFCASLILTGGPQMVISRYLADRLYVNDWACIVPTCNGVLLLATPLLAVAAPFLLLAPFDWRYRLIVVTLFIVLCVTWLMSIFLSAARDYANIVRSFAIGYAVSFGATMALSHWAGLIGGLSGYTLGQAIIMALLVAQVYREFEPSDAVNFAFISYAWRYWDLLFLGLLYSVGIWADNIIHWFLKGSHTIGGFYRIHTVYDTTKLLAYMTTILASAMFLVHIETSFARHYRSFYRRIEEQGTLADIEEAKAGMIAAARAGLTNVLKLQIVVVGAVMLLAPDIVTRIGLPPAGVGLLRISVLAANGQFTMLITMLLLLYLDQRRSALRVALLFLATNVGCTLLAIPLGQRFDGLGYLVATLASAIVTLVMLFDRLHRLEYLTFMLQPIAQSASHEDAERPVHGGWWAAHRRARAARTLAARTLEAS